MYEFIYHTILSLKYVGIALLMAIFPAEAVMPFVGYKAAQGLFWLPTAILVGVLGSTIGSTIIYALARKLERKTVSRFADTHGKWIGVSAKSVERAARMFDAHERSAVFFGRFIPGVRSAVSVPAGYRRMSVASFMFYTALGSAVSSVLLALIGYYTTVSLARLQTSAVMVTYAVGGALLIIFAGWLLLRHRRVHQ